MFGRDGLMYADLIKYSLNTILLINIEHDVSQKVVKFKVVKI